MVHGENRIPYWIDRSLTGLAGPEYDATISFGLPFELGDCPYGKYRLNARTSPPTLRRRNYPRPAFGCDRRSFKQFVGPRE